MAVLLAGCQTAPAPKFAGTNAAPVDRNAVPYQWTLGNAAKAHKDLVAAFGRVGLKPGEYGRADTARGEAETRIVVELLPQTPYVYLGDALLGASTSCRAKTC